MAQTERLSMAEGTTGSGPEGGQVGAQAAGPVGTEGSVKPQISSEAKVLTNASLADKERLQAAKGLLGTQLNPGQEKAILEAHKVGSGETGKDSSEAGVYNYKLGQIREKARILKEAGFNKEQIRSLMESGLAGRLPPTDFATFDPNAYDGDPKLTRIAGKIKATGDAGFADEGFLYKNSALLKRLDDEAEVEGVGAQDILNQLEVWQAKADDPLFPYAEKVRIEQRVAREEGVSEFNIAKAEYNYYMEHSIPTDPGMQQELQTRKEKSRERIEQLEQDAENHKVKPLKELFKRVLESYKKIKETRVRELQGRGREVMIEQERSKGPMQEKIFDDAAELAPLKAKFGGLAHYLWDGVNVAIGFEEEGITRKIKHPLAERIFTMIKHQRARDRMSTKEIRYAQAESYWGGEIVTLFSWPESARDLILTTLDWVKDRIADIGERDPKTINDETEDIRRRGTMLQKNARIRMNTEEVLVAKQGKILETNPEYLRARAVAEGLPDVFANEMIMKKGNTEFGPQAKERFAAKFIKNFDAAYLENRKAARLMHMIRKYKQGTYWMGQDWNAEKLEEGQIKDYRAQIQEDLLEDAATHDFFTGTIFVANQDLFPELIKDKDDLEDVKLGYKDFFELRERDKLQYSANDPLERLLLDPDNEIRKRIAATGDTEALKRHDLRVGVFRRTKEMLDEQDGWGFVSPQERRLLEKQKRRPLSEEELMELAESKKGIMRTQLQQSLKSQGYDPGLYTDWIEEQLSQVNGKRRQEGLRDRIRREMEIKSSSSHFAQRSAKDLAEFDAAKSSGDLANCDRIVWEWAKDYNQYRIEAHLPKWYPSGWDRVRIKIDRPAKVIDRGLSEAEFEAMYEQVQLPQVPDDDEEGKERIKDIVTGHREDSRFGFEIARSFQVFQMEDALLGGMRARLRAPKGYKIDGKDVSGEYIGRLPDDETSLLLGLIREKKDPATGQVMKDAKGNVIYETVDPDRKMIRVWDVVEARLAAAIAAEEKVIEKAKAEKKAAIASGNQALIKEKSDVLRRIFADAQFVATHALKAKGLVNGRLPVWSYNFLDNSTIQAFTTAMAEYGVEISVGNAFSHDSKPQIYEYLERGRRGLDSEMIRATQEFMIGTFPVYERDENGEVIYIPLVDEKGKPVLGENGQQQRVPKPAVSLISAADAWGEPGPSEDRLRVVSKGAVSEDTMVTEAEYNISTSGGVKVNELIPSMGRLGYFPLSIWLATPSILDLNNYIKRRNEVEYHRHRFFDVKDAPTNNKAQAAAYLARKALTGGSLGEGKSTPGFLNEPFHGAYKVADLLKSWLGIGTPDLKLKGINATNTHDYVVKMAEWRTLGDKFTEQEELEKLRQFTYLDYDKLSRDKEMNDALYATVTGVLDYYTMYIQAEKEVQQNRIGNAPRNYVYDNTLKWFAFRREMRKAIEKGERGFIDRLGYSQEVASEISIRMMETVLHDADYLILRDYERDRLAREGAEILSRTLSAQERTQGFEIKGKDGETQRTLVIPDEKNWSNLVRPEIKKALESIRRRGLLEFMKEEGYKIYDLDDKDQFKREDGKLLYFKEVLGEKIPPLVRRYKANEDKTGKLLAAA